MNKLVLETYFCNFEDYDMFDRTLDALKDEDIGIELHIFDDPAFNARLRAKRDHYASFYTTFHGPHMGVELASPKGSAVQKRGIAAWEEAFRMYLEFGAHGIVMHTNQLSFRPEDKAHLQQQSIDTMNILLDSAQPLGIDVLVENVGWHNTDSMLFDEDEFIALFDKLRPWAHCLLDTGHAFINRWDMEKVIKALAHRIKAYHLHNNDGEQDTHHPLFEAGGFYSEADIVALLGMMDRHTPDADWILEYAPCPKITPEVVVHECKRLLDLSK